MKNLRISVISFSLCLLSLLLYGCAAYPSKITEKEGKIKEVAVISLVQNSVPVSRIGLTVFNNASTSFVPSTNLNELISQKIETHLRSSRPNWRIRTAIPSTELLGRLDALEKKGGNAEEYRALIRDTAQSLSKNGADAVFIAMSSPRQYQPFRNAAGVFLRTSNTSQLQDAWIFGTVSIAITFEDGELAASSSAPDGYIFTKVSADKIGLTYKIEDGLMPTQKASIEDEIDKQFSINIARTLSQMGY